MPANKKYLTFSKGQRFLKLSAGFFGGFLVTLSLHLTLAQWLNKSKVLITMTFSGFILWAFLLLFAFLVKNGWKIWGLYLVVTLFLFGLLLLAKASGVSS